MFSCNSLYFNALSATPPGLLLASVLRFLDFCWCQCYASWTFAGVSATLPGILLAVPRLLDFCWRQSHASWAFAGGARFFRSCSGCR